MRWDRDHIHLVTDSCMRRRTGITVPKVLTDGSIQSESAVYYRQVMLRGLKVMTVATVVHV